MSSRQELAVNELMEAVETAARNAAPGERYVSVILQWKNQRNIKITLDLETGNISAVNATTGKEIDISPYL
jgi:hypothetical protein